MTRFKEGDIIKCNYTDSDQFAEREIMPDSTNNPYGYITRFLEDNSIVESSKKVIDRLYSLK